MDSSFERVYTVWDVWDRPREGIADFQGEPHVFRSVFRDDLDDWDPDRHELQPVSHEALALALEQWALFVRWREAVDAGRLRRDSYPALPEDAARRSAVEAALEPLVAPDPARTFVARGEFRAAPQAPGERPSLVLRRWEVRWPLDSPDPAA